MRARYANRVAIANSSLLGRDGSDVLFWYKDYPDSGRRKVLRLPAVKFIRRFLQHVLPLGLRHIRHCGFLSANQRRRPLPQIRQLLGVAAPADEEPEPGRAEDADDAAGDDDREPTGPRCPVCQVGRMLRGAEFPRPTIAELLAVRNGGVFHYCRALMK